MDFVIIGEDVVARGLSKGKRSGDRVRAREPVSAEQVTHDALGERSGVLLSDPSIFAVEKVTSAFEDEECVVYVTRDADFLAEILGLLGLGEADELTVVLFGDSWEGNRERSGVVRSS